MDTPTAIVNREAQLADNRKRRRAGDDTSRELFRALIAQLRPIAASAIESGFTEQDFIDAARSAY